MKFYYTTQTSQPQTTAENQLIIEISNLQLHLLKFYKILFANTFDIIAKLEKNSSTTLSKADIDLMIDFCNKLEDDKIINKIHPRAIKELTKGERLDTIEERLKLLKIADKLKNACLKTLESDLTINCIYNPPCQ